MKDCTYETGLHVIFLRTGFWRPTPPWLLFTSEQAVSTCHADFHGWTLRTKEVNKDPGPSLPLQVLRPCQPHGSVPEPVSLGWAPRAGTLFFMS